MTITVDAVQTHLETFAEHVAAGPPPADLVGEAEGLFSRLNGTEGEHIAAALETEDFPFQQVQEQLSDCFQEFARLTQAILERVAKGTPAWTRLEELAFLAESAPVASTTTLNTIRAARSGRSGRHERVLA